MFNAINGYVKTGVHLEQQKQGWMEKTIIIFRITSKLQMQRQLPF